MKVGVMFFPTDRSMDPVTLAREVEARGFESLWFPEHSHIPISRRTPFPGGEPLPEEYYRLYDPLVALAFAAAATERLLVATGICLVAQRDPVHLAKEVASLDRLSGGRFLFGVGYGWNAEEMENHGVDPTRRRAVTREKVLAIQELWTKDEAGFEGEHVHIEPSWMWPKPQQRPHPPIHIGGAAGPTTFRHVVELATGWIPIAGRGLTAAWAALRLAAEEAGRDPASIEVSTLGAQPDAAVLGHYRDAGLTRAVLRLPSAGRDEVLSVLDDHAAVAARLA